MLSVRPRSISPRVIANLRIRLKKTVEFLRDSLPSLPPDIDQALMTLKKAIRETREYARFLAMASHLQHLEPERSGFDDHDQVSSMLLYLITRYDRWRQTDGIPPPRMIQKWVLDHLERLDVSRARVFEKLNPFPDHIRPCHFGILTALEHEYQSVVRRLDRVVECTDDSAYGLAVLDRMRSTEDPKDSAKLLGRARPVSAGWTMGYIGAKSVIVVCTGHAGREIAQECKAGVQALFGIPMRGWIVTGICAGTDSDWPIGTVLISRKWIAAMRATHPNRYVVDRNFSPMTLKAGMPRTFPLDILFRRTPQAGRLGISIADSKTVPILFVKFACTTEVINKTSAREGIRSCLIKDGKLVADEEFGIEMEGPGVDVYNEPMMCIVKGVCDYADSRKSRWGSAIKMSFQLYAAESAAECTTALIRRT